ncbi:uncharacterized protein MONOS_12996 [Monocercomonoides exilis]|uniref:uncharacterized protein n=1 Tax=Monocercomonoides exilis TaxID=2049356 RepID=UPI00355ABCD2|nr:hypothetical protein MONOS_12996 [Monocercomonoides exilis]|eukprot:MONOS_12996.1-p1 / transcript=MONOS_12996.1 / gene=MONOS_12996 / organism=Monocercomonoides_exilis_PA203 / gene_product=unspecified product / transcript_product=unspecified product / location=Mono_scaffold00764:17967-18941(+) / protein_length=325 / sequence_SO=supercontig / SO=protein_coding / is_pseudo=false
MNTLTDQNQSATSDSPLLAVESAVETESSQKSSSNPCLSENGDFSLSFPASETADASTKFNKVEVSTHVDANRTENSINSAITSTPSFKSSYKEDSLFKALQKPSFSQSNVTQPRQNIQSEPNSMNVESSSKNCVIHSPMKSCEPSSSLLSTLTMAEKFTKSSSKNADALKDELPQTQHSGIAAANSNIQLLVNKQTIIGDSEKADKETSKALIPKASAPHESRSEPKQLQTPPLLHSASSAKEPSAALSNESVAAVHPKQLSSTKHSKPETRFAPNSKQFSSTQSSHAYPSVLNNSKELQTSVNSSSTSRVKDLIARYNSSSH